MNNYTIQINFAKADCNPKYMQVLGDIIKHGKTTRRASVKRIWGENASISDGWNCGPYTLLHENGFITYNPHTKMWKPTVKGMKFYAKHNNNFITKQINKQGK